MIMNQLILAHKQRISTIYSLMWEFIDSFIVNQLWRYKLEEILQNLQQISYMGENIATFSTNFAYMIKLGDIFRRH